MLELVSGEIVLHLSVESFEEFLEVLLHFFQVVDALFDQSIAEAVEDLGEEKVQERVEAQDEERDEVDAPEEGGVVGGQHDVGEVRRRQQDQHAVVRHGQIIKVQVALYRKLKDKVSNRAVDQDEQKDAQEDDRRVLYIFPERRRIVPNRGHAACEKKWPQKG